MDTHNRIMWVSMLLLAFVIGGMFGETRRRLEMEARAVAAGVAEYYVDANEQTKFRFTRFPLPAADYRPEPAPRRRAQLPLSPGRPGAASKTERSDRRRRLCHHRRAFRGFRVQPTGRVSLNPIPVPRSPIPDPWSVAT